MPRVGVTKAFGSPRARGAPARSTEIALHDAALVRLNSWTLASVARYTTL